MGDDFGDLYADVEVEASLAVNGVPDFTKLCIESEHDTKNNNTKKPVAVEDPVSDFGKLISIAGDTTRPVDYGASQKAASFEADGSDSEDDLNIVLNDDDCKIFPVTCGAIARNGGHEAGEDGDFGASAEGNGLVKNRKLSDQIGNGLELISNGISGERGNGRKGAYNSQYLQYKYIRAHASVILSNVGVNGSVKVASFSSTSARGDWEDNRCNRIRSSSSGQVSSIHANASSIVPQCGYGISLPWYRTILDVNIDTFKERPWRRPGADITDFFNFGFGEESWKLYCNSLEQFRQRISMRTKNPGCDCSKLDQVNEVDYENEKVDQEAVAEDSTQVDPSSGFVDGRRRPPGLPRGRAIQVENSIGERQPSRDIRRPRSRDSDVVIQITVQNSTVGPSDSGKVELPRIDDNGNTQLSGSASGNEVFVELLGESSAPGRCSEPINPSSQMTLDADNQEKGKVHGNPKLNDGSSDRIAAVMDIINNEEKEVAGNTSNSDPSVIEIESSHGAWSHFSPTASCSGSDYEASRGTVHGDSMEIHSPLRQPLTELHESVTLDYKRFKRNDTKTKPKNDKKCLRRKNFVQEKGKHQNGRLYSFMRGGIYPENYDASPRSNAKNDRKKYARHESPIREERIFHSERLDTISKRKFHHRNGDDASALSNEDYHRAHTSMDVGRWKKRWQGYDYDNREDFSYDRSHGSGNVRYAEDCPHAVHSKYHHGKSHQNFREEVDQYGRKSCDERKYFHERRPIVDEEHDIDGDWYCYRRGHSTKDENPLTYVRPRRLLSKCSSDYKVRDAPLRREVDKFQFRRRADYDDCLHNYENEEELSREKYGRSVSFTGWERDSFVENYEEDFPLFRRELELSDRSRYQEASRLRLDRPRSMETGSECKRNADHKFLPSWSFKEFYSAKGARKDVYRNNVKHFRVIEPGHRCRRQTHEDEGRADQYRCFGTEHTEDNVLYRDEQTHLSRTRSSWRSKAMHWTKDETVLRHRDNELLTDEEIAVNDKISTKCASAKVDSHMVETELVHDGYKMIRGEHHICSVNRDTDTVYRDEHELAISRCRDSVDLIVGEGKFPGRYSTGRRMAPNDRAEKMGLKFAKRQRVFQDFDKCLGEEAVQADVPHIEGTKNNKMWVGKFPVIEQNQDLDIEEGQIVMEEPNRVDKLEEKFVCRAPAQTDKKGSRTENISNGKAEIDEQRILEALAKIQKRRERFKEPITVKKEAEKTIKAQAEMIAETTGTNQQRPARKRRWGGS